MRRKQPTFKPRSASEIGRIDAAKTVKSAGDGIAEQKCPQSSVAPASPVASVSEQSAEAVAETLKPSEEQLAVSEGVKREIEKRQKKATVINKLSAVWTLLSTVYAIASTCLFIAKGWVADTASIVLVSILAVYVCVFIVLVVMTFKDVKGGTKRVKTYKKTLKIFKAAANIILLSIAAVSMVGMSFEGFDVIAKFIVFILTFVIAAVQLGLGVAQLIIKFLRVRIAKKFKVEFVKFVDGKKKKKSVLYKLKENKYKDN